MQYLEVKWSEFSQSCPTLCDPMDCSLQGFSVHGIFHARALEWVAISFSRGASRPRDWTRGSHIASIHFYYLSHQGSPKQNFKEVIKLKWDPLSGAVILQDCCLYKKGRDIRNAHRGMPCEEMVRRWAHTSQGERETKPAEILILDFQPPEMWENIFLLFTPLRL